MILHTVSSCKALNDCRRLCAGDDVVLCMDDSVYALRNTVMSRQQLSGSSGIAFKVLASDLIARGIDIASLLAGVEVCDDDALLTLSMQASKVIHWG